MESLEHSTTGRFVVATESGSRYLIDFDWQASVRLPGVDEEGLLAMRGDCHGVRLMRLVKCVVVGSMHLRIDLGVPGALFTDRQTTAVLGIAEDDGCVAAELGAFICRLGQGPLALDDALWQLTKEEEHHGNR